MSYLFDYKHPEVKSLAMRLAQVYDLKDFCGEVLEAVRFGTISGTSVANSLRLPRWLFYVFGPHLEALYIISRVKRLGPQRFQVEIMEGVKALGWMDWVLFSYKLSERLPADSRQRQLSDLINQTFGEAIGDMLLSWRMGDWDVGPSGRSTIMSELERTRKGSRKAHSLILRETRARAGGGVLPNWPDLRQTEEMMYLALVLLRRIINKKKKRKICTNLYFVVTTKRTEQLEELAIAVVCYWSYLKLSTAQVKIWDYPKGVLKWPKTIVDKSWPGHTLRMGAKAPGSWLAGFKACGTRLKPSTGQNRTRTIQGYKDRIAEDKGLQEKEAEQWSRIVEQRIVDLKINNNNNNKKNKNKGKRKSNKKKRKKKKRKEKKKKKKKKRERENNNNIKKQQQPTIPRTLTAALH
ncbi:hypothetical protein PPACK8108_LOCUS22321 [Phakopsora pachyrhizi]|uniref:Uncharacterized protein n=1 Tax=Phakopsora pachyrhizi TaxID=170000 RepID=A0AAV0BPL5_PHAPC|nr:hypothetical protein PPACK8108_LOCUS22321 [Phakopsora pachyrhizi]